MSSGEEPIDEFIAKLEAVAAGSDLDGLGYLLAGVRRWYGLGFPLATLLFLYILWRATLLTLWRDGIDWRGTHYSLAELKANKL